MTAAKKKAAAAKSTKKKNKENGEENGDQSGKGETGNGNEPDVILPDESQLDTASGQEAQAASGKESDAEKGVTVDFPAKQEKAQGAKKKAPSKSPAPDPFKKSKLITKRIRLFIWGSSGVGKTTLALGFPKPCIIDMEKSAELYGDSFDFGVKETKDPDVVMKTIDWLLTTNHGYKTAIIDPFTVYWESIQAKWEKLFLKRRHGKKGHKGEFYDLQPGDWKHLKAEIKELFRKLHSLDMNVIVTARLKDKYKDSPGDFMVKDGETFDGEKSLEYMFHTVIHMYRGKDGKRMGHCTKDRSNHIPEDSHINAEYKTFEKMWGRDILDRDAKPIELITDDQKKELVSYLGMFKFSPEELRARLAKYHATEIKGLTRESAEQILGAMRPAVKARKKKAAMATEE